MNSAEIKKRINQDNQLPKRTRDNLITALKYLESCDCKSEQKLIKFAENDDFYDGLARKLRRDCDRKGRSEATRSSRVSNLKRLRGMVGSAVLSPSEEITERRPLMQSLPDKSEVSRLSFWEYYSTLTAVIFPDTKNQSEIIRRLGLDDLFSTMRGSMRANRAPKYETADTVRHALLKFVDFDDDELMRKALVPTVKTAKKTTQEFYRYTLTETQENEIDDYIKYRTDKIEPDRKIWVGIGDAKYAYSSWMKWKKNSASKKNFRNNMRAYYGYLSTVLGLQDDEINLSTLINHELFESYLKHKLMNTSHRCKKIIDTAKLANDASEYFWKYHPPYPDFNFDQASQYVQHMSKMIAYYNNQFDVRDKNKKDDLTLQEGKQNAPWFFAPGIKANDGFGVLTKIITELELNYDALSLTSKPRAADRQLMVATWLSMEMELPLRVGNTDALTVVKSLNPGDLPTTPVMFKAGNTWNIFCPKQALKNSYNRHTIDIEYEYSKRTSKLIDKYLSTLAKGKKPFTSLSNKLSETTKNVLHKLFPDAGYPGMNPHVMRHIVPTYRVSCGWTPAQVSSLLMDDINTLTKNYFQNDHALNLETASHTAADLWA